MCIDSFGLFVHFVVLVCRSIQVGLRGFLPCIDFWDLLYLLRFEGFLTLLTSGLVGFWVCGFVVCFLCVLPVN